MGLTGVAGWLSVVDHAPDQFIWVRIVGGVCGDRAEDLWSTLEMAVQDAAGRMVVVDLANISAFDIDAVEAVQTVARKVKRWRVSMCAIAKPASAISDYLLAYSVDQLIPLYPSRQAMRDMTEGDETARGLISSYLWARDRACDLSRPTPSLRRPAIA